MHRLGAQKSSQKGAQKSAQKSAQKILDAIGRYVAITIDELSSQLAISPRAVKNHLHNLKKAGRLKRIGPDKGGHWEVVR
ncbi:MAG: helix-turn-helix domain-containing protein [Verrucomicrobiota bacterium]